jgi:hypothetical protein
VLGILVPGVREVRAPLAAGTLLLVSAYLLLYDSADAVFAGGNVSPGLRSVYDTLGRTGLLAAGAVGAYLVGSVLTGFLTRSLRLAHAVVVPRLVDPSYLDVPRKPRALALYAPFSRASLRRVCHLSETHGVPADAVLAEVVLSGGKRLLGRNRDLYGDYDRFQSEAELRLAVAAPAVLLAVAVALQVPAAAGVEVGAVALVAAIGVALVRDALTIQRDAHSMYAHLVADGVISTPTLDAAHHGDPPPPVDTTDDD